MKKSLKLCTYPQEGFGGKCGQKYLLDQFGNKYHFQTEYDKELDERFWTIEIDNVQEHGDSPQDIVEKLRDLYEFDIKEW